MAPATSPAPQPRMSRPRRARPRRRQHDTALDADRPLAVGRQFDLGDAVLDRVHRRRRRHRLPALPRRQPGRHLATTTSASPASPAERRTRSASPQSTAPATSPAPQPRTSRPQRARLRRRPTRHRPRRRPASRPPASRRRSRHFPGQPRPTTSASPATSSSATATRSGHPPRRATATRGSPAGRATRSVSPRSMPPATSPARRRRASQPLPARILLGRSVGAYSQQYAASGLAGLVPLLSNRAGTDYTITGAAPPLSLRRNIAVVLGGSQGVAALADRPGIEAGRLGCLHRGRSHRVRGLPRTPGHDPPGLAILLADERPADIAVEGTRSLAKLAGSTSDPQLDRLETDVPTDQSAQTGSLTDVMTPIPLPGSALSSSVFSVRSRQQVEIWARVMATPLAATIQARVDGRPVGSVTPITLGHGGFEWLRLAVAHVGAGVHRGDDLRRGIGVR